MVTQPSVQCGRTISVLFLEPKQWITEPDETPDPPGTGPPVKGIPAEEKHRSTFREGLSLIKGSKR
jgi:hypothetical protein